MIQALASLSFVLAVAMSGAQAQEAGAGPTVVAASVVALSNYRHTLTGEEIRAGIIGNTITGADEHGSFSEFLDRNGAIRGVSGSDRFTGVWRIKGDQICIRRYDPDANEWDCNSVTFDNGNIFWTDQPDEDDPVDASLVAGNPNGL